MSDVSAAQSRPQGGQGEDSVSQSTPSSSSTASRVVLVVALLATCLLAVTVRPVATAERVPSVWPDLA